MIENRFEFTENFGPEGPPTMIMKWVSSDGVEWDIEPDFVETQWPGWRYVFHADDQALAMLLVRARPELNLAYEEFIRPNLASVEPIDRVDEVCFWINNRTPGDRMLEGYACEDNDMSIVQIEPSDLADPDQADFLFRCVSEGSFGFQSAVEVISQDETRQIVTDQNSGVPAILNDGTVATVDQSGRWLEQAGCGDFAEIAESSLVLSMPGEPDQVFSLPDEVVERGFQTGPVSSDGAGGLILIGENGIHRFDLGSMEWSTDIVDLESGETRFGAPQAFVLNRTSTVFIFEGRTLRFGDLGGELREIELDQTLRLIEPLILDDNRLIFRTDRGTFSVINFPAS